MQHHFHDLSDKFSSLAPLDTPGVKNSRWILNETTVPNYRQAESLQTISTPELLQLMLQLIDSRAASISSVPETFWQSDYKRYCIGYHHVELSVHSLFVQRKGDFLTCLELFIDGQLKLLFREPLWPHLQSSEARCLGTTRLPVKCLEAIVDGQVFSDLESAKSIDTSDNIPTQQFDHPILSAG